MRHAYTTQKTSLTVTDLHTAAFLCRGLIYWSSPCSTSALSTQGPSPSCQQTLYADCGVSLAELIPQVSYHTSICPARRVFELA